MRRSAGSVSRTTGCPVFSPERPGGECCGTARRDAWPRHGITAALAIRAAVSRRGQAIAFSTWSAVHCMPALQAMPQGRWRRSRRDSLTFVGTDSQFVERRTTPSVVPAHAAPMWTTSIRVGTIGRVMDPRAPAQWSTPALPAFRGSRHTPAPRLREPGARLSSVDRIARS
jgi:hypothetical protein